MISITNPMMVFLKMDNRKCQELSKKQISSNPAVLNQKVPHHKPHSLKCMTLIVSLQGHPSPEDEGFA